MSNPGSDTQVLPVIVPDIYGIKNIYKHISSEMWEYSSLKKKIAKNGEADGVCKKIKLRIESVKDLYISIFLTKNLIQWSPISKEISLKMESTHAELCILQWLIHGLLTVQIFFSFFFSFTMMCINACFVQPYMWNYYIYCVVYVITAFMYIFWISSPDKMICDRWTDLQFWTDCILSLYIKCWIHISYTNSCNNLICLA